MQVTKFDMLAGTEVYWWGALGTDFKNLTTGHPVSDQKLNQTYSNATLYVCDRLQLALLSLYVTYDAELF